MAYFRPLSITNKIILVLLAGLVVNAIFLMLNSEEQIEELILDQVTKQAQIYLMGVEQEIQNLPNPEDPVALTGLLRSALDRRSRRFIDFYPNQLYIYGQDGHIVAHTKPGNHPAKALTSFYGDVLRTGVPFVSGVMEERDESPNSRPELVMDIILPLRLKGAGVDAGLEAEINVDATRTMTQKVEQRYEREIMAILTLSAGMLFLLFWWLMHRLVLRHVSTFERVTGAIALGDLEQRAPLPLPKDEVGHLGLSINIMADSIAALLKEQEESYMQTLQALAKALEAKDAYTVSHSSRVAKYSVMLGRFLGVPEEKLRLLQRGALMHDLGKIGIPDAILNKPTGLTEEEFLTMKKHPLFTATIMRPLQRFKEFTEIAAWHHERWDGAGYPDGLQGETIPLLARIVAIADTWDAMTGDRVYRKGMPVEKALAILERECELGQWDPALMRRFIEMMRQEEKN